LISGEVRSPVCGGEGSRTLIIVGASHKGYLEAYLNQMDDVRVVSTGQVLR